VRGSRLYGFLRARAPILSLKNSEKTPVAEYFRPAGGVKGKLN
jgi:hypothetical protein